MKRIVLTGLIGASVCLSAAAESSVWKVQKDDSVIYLGGTVHLLRPSDLPLPAEFDAAYRLADLLVFETDVAALQSPQTRQKLMAGALYADGSTIDRHLSAETYGLLAEYCADNGVPVDSFKRFRPPMVAVSLVMMELMKAGVTSEGVELNFHRRAGQDSKACKFLETVDEQINCLLEMGKGNEDALIAYTIRDIKKTEACFNDIIAAWKAGDADRLHTLMNQELREMPGLYNQLLVERNRKWLPNIEAFQATPQKELILVGAAHLVGPDGLLETLRQKGCRIEKVEAAPPAE